MRPRLKTGTLPFVVFYWPKSQDQPRVKGQGVKVHFLMMDATKSHWKGRGTLEGKTYWYYYFNLATTILFGVTEESNHLVIPNMVEDIAQGFSCRITNLE